MQAERVKLHHSAARYPIESGIRIVPPTRERRTCEFGSTFAYTDWIEHKIIP